MNSGSLNKTNKNKMGAAKMKFLRQAKDCLRIEHMRNVDNNKYIYKYEVAP